MNNYKIRFYLDR